MASSDAMPHNDFYDSSTSSDQDLQTATSTDSLRTQNAGNISTELPSRDETTPPIPKQNQEDMTTGEKSDLESHMKGDENDAEQVLDHKSQVDNKTASEVLESGTDFQNMESNTDKILVESEQDEEDESDDESDDEDDEPPLLKYTRLNQLPANFFIKDPVSTATFSDKVFVFGTHSGLIHLTNSDFSTIRSFRAHKASILSLYTDGQFFASGSMDGTVVIGSVSDAKDIVMFDYKRPIHAVVLDKNYQRSRSFVCGGMAGLVIYSSKNWLDQRVDTYLDKDNGPIIAIHTLDDIILWMNDKGITVYHTTARQVISVIAKPSNSFRSDLYWPRVSFPETDRALIAWGNYVWSLRISTKGSSGSNAGAGSSVKSRILPSAASLSFRSVVERKVEVEHVFKVDFLISGIAGFHDDQWAVLAYNQPKQNDRTGKLISQCPDLKILNSVDGSTVFEEELDFKRIEGLGVNDYHMFSHIGTSTARYMILSARDGIVAQQIQLDDRLGWCLEKQKFDEAWRMSQHLVTPAKRLSFGVKYLDLLVKDDHWGQAADWLPQILFVDTNLFPVGDTRSTLGTRVSSNSQMEEIESLMKDFVNEWNSWAEIFIKAGHVPELTEVLPSDPRWNLKKSIFTDILIYWLVRPNGNDEFYQLLKKWDTDLYDVKRLTGSMEHSLEVNPDDTKLRSQICSIYEKTLEPSKAVSHLYLLEDTEIIEFLDKNHILTTFTSDIPKFLKLRFPNTSDIGTLPIPDIEKNLNPIIEILITRRFEIVPRAIVDLMKQARLEIVNFLFLEKLAEIDELLVKGFENVRIDLFAQFDRPKLLPFLSANKDYEISTAIKTCESNAFVDELVFLLGEVGENKKAMSLIMEELDDPVRAIKFAKIRNDSDTWKMLLDYSFSRPNFIKSLLEMADDQSSKFYNPVMILQNMATDVHIEGLKSSLTKVSEDHDMNVIVNQLLLKIVYKRSEEISKKFKEEKLKGFLISADDPSFQAISRKYETLVLLPDPSNPSKQQIKPVSELIDDDKDAKKSFTDTARKLKHFQSIKRRYEESKRTYVST